MVLNLLFDFVTWIFSLIADAMPATQPVMYSAFTLFNDILGFGIWIIGEDMWTLIISSVAAWLTFKLVWGVVLFIYRLIPLIH